MTNKTTEQDMEAKSVDKNDSTMTKTPDINGEITAESLNDDATQHATPEDTHTNLPEEAEAAKEVTETVHEEPLVVEEEPEPDYSIVAPGSLSRALKRCRDEADMSVEDAAQEMRLPLSVVKSLESENFAELPDPPYVRGYLRSYARLNESDPGNLINHYETLRGADPKDIASFTPTTPRYQPSSKKAVSPTTIKLAGFSMIVMLLVVLSMIPAVSQWASDTWQSFSEPQNQQLAARTASEQSTDTESQAADNQTTDDTKQDNNTQEAQNTESADNAASNSDTATPDNSEQLALNQEDSDTSTPAQNEDTAADNTEAADQDKTPEQAADATASDTAAEDTEKTTEETATAESSGEDATTNEKEQDAATETDADTNETTQTETAAAPDSTNEPTNATDTDTAQDTTNTETDAGTQEQEQATAEKAATEKAEADKIAAQQAAAQQNDNFKQPIDGSVLIRLVFTQPVWMSIKDGRGKTIFASLNAAGTRKELKANTPLQFKVGNAPGVQIYLNGQLIDQKPYTRGSVSTFRAN